MRSRFSSAVNAAVLAISFCSVTVQRAGAVTINPTSNTQAVQAAINAAPLGDTVTFAPGAFNLDNTLVLPGNRNYQGSTGTTLNFTLATGKYAIAVGANASNMTVSGLNISGGGIRLTDGSKISNVTFSQNEITRTANTPGFYSTVASDNLQITHNTLYSFAHWGAILWGMDHGSYSDNVFRNIYQGAQIMNPGDTVDVSNNVGKGLRRMGLEIQQTYGPDQTNYTYNLSVKNNVFFGFDHPYYDTFGLSVMPQAAVNTVVSGNYVAATFDGNWGKPDGGGSNRFGFGIESGFGANGSVDNNTVIGPYWWGIVTSQQNMPITGNHLYRGDPNSAIGGENGSIPVLSANEILPLAAAPVVPQWALDRLDGTTSFDVVSMDSTLPEPGSTMIAILIAAGTGARRARR